MYKVIIEKKDGDKVVTTTIETEDVDLVKQLLEVKNLKLVTSDEPNLNVNRKWQEIMTKWEEDLKKYQDQTQIKPNTDTFPPFDSPFYPTWPFTIQC